MTRTILESQHCLRVKGQCQNTLIQVVWLVKQISFKCFDVPWFIFCTLIAQCAWFWTSESRNTKNLYKWLELPTF